MRCAARTCDVVLFHNGSRSSGSIGTFRGVVGQRLGGRVVVVVELLLEVVGLTSGRGLERGAVVGVLGEVVELVVGEQGIVVGVQVVGVLGEVERGLVMRPLSLTLFSQCKGGRRRKKRDTGVFSAVWRFCHLLICRKRT